MYVVSEIYNEVMVRSEYPMQTTVSNVVERGQTPFKNEPLIDFSNEANREAQSKALERVKSELGRTYPLIIGGNILRMSRPLNR
jgi:1-pyrroline-5-carboxylate dehydrogenase